MASWASDGHVSGYDGPAGTPSSTALGLLTAGMVDTNGVTRLQYVGTPSLGGARENLLVTGEFTFTSADVAADTSRPWLSMDVIVAPASAFSGVPSASDVYHSPAGKWYRTPYAHKAAGTYTHIGTIPVSQLSPNTKYWVLAFPVRWATVGDTPNETKDHVIGTVTANGRGVSIWTNRSPAAPTITSPAPGSIKHIGDSFNLTWTSGDPDDSAGGRVDAAGVEIQYSAIPSPANPSPTWSNLSLRAEAFDPALYPSWAFVNNVANFNGSWTGPPYTHPMIAAESVSVLCGNGMPGTYEALLPPGNWQIRVRTFDYGYPDTRYPLGIGAGGDGKNTLMPSTYVSGNISPWSTPVKVYVEAVVLPPAPLSPVNGVALVEGSTVTLKWKYRSTVTPPYAQATRSVRLRKYGSSTWTNLLTADSSADTTFVVPGPTSTETLLPIVNGGFETGDLDHWTASAGGANVVTTSPHSGTYCLHLTPSSLGVTVKQDVSVLPGDTVTVDAWAMHDTGGGSLPGHANVICQWIDATGAVLDSTVIGSVSSGIWTEVNSGAVVAPAGATARRVILTSDNVGDYAFFDDVVVTRVTPNGVDLEATTLYEWQVSVTDDHSNDSGWSQSGLFWIIPAPMSGSVISPGMDSIPGATLGTGKHRAFIYRKGGTRRLGEIGGGRVDGLMHVDWSRTRDAISTAKVIVTGWDNQEGAMLAAVDPWVYELVIYRDNGADTDRVWEGPIGEVTYEENQVTIQAFDVMNWLYRRINKLGYDDSALAVSAVARAVQEIQDSLAPDDPNLLAYLNPIENAGDVNETRTVLPWSRTVYEDVDDMASNAGIDYTVIGRSITIWDTNNAIGKLPELRDRDFGSPPIVSVYGMSFANLYAVTDGTGVWGEVDTLDAFGGDEDHGLVEILATSAVSNSNTDTGTLNAESLADQEAALRDQASRGMSGRNPMPILVRVPAGTSLNPDAPIRIQQLVPGVVIPVRSERTLRKVAQDQKLDSVTVTEEGGKETITINLSPFNPVTGSIAAEASTE